MTTIEDQDPNLDIDDAIRRVRSGDNAAFEVVVRTFARPLRGWLASCGLPGVDVDDVAQRNFVAAFTRLDDYNTGTNFRLQGRE